MRFLGSPGITAVSELHTVKRTLGEARSILQYLPICNPHGVVLKNRICYSNGQQHLVTGPESAPNEAMIDDVAIFARSGASLMNFGHFGGMGGGGVPRHGSSINKKEIRAKGGCVVADSKEEPFGSAASFNYDDARTFNIIGQVAEAAHLYDTKVVVKLGAAFPNGVCKGCLRPKS